MRATGLAGGVSGSGSSLLTRRSSRVLWEGPQVASGCWACPPGHMPAPQTCPQGTQSPALPDATSPSGPAALSLQTTLPAWPGRGHGGLAVLRYMPHLLPVCRPVLRFLPKTSTGAPRPPPRSRSDISLAAAATTQASWVLPQPPRPPLRALLPDLRGQAPAQRRHKECWPTPTCPAGSEPCHPGRPPWRAGAPSQPAPPTGR